LHSRATSARTFFRAHAFESIRILPDAPRLIRRPGGCLRASGGEGRAHQKGSRRFVHDAFTFARLQPVQQLVQRLFLFMEAPMRQLELMLLGRVDAPSVVPPCALRSVRSYRDAVRLCWTLRRAKGMKLSDLGREHGFTRQHVSDYLNGDDKPTRRSLPPGRIADFEDLCGNVAITQWLASRAKLTVLEEIQAERLAA